MDNNFEKSACMSFVKFEILLPNPQSNLAVIVKSAEHYSRSLSLALSLSLSLSLWSIHNTAFLCPVIVGFINDDTVITITTIIIIINKLSNIVSMKRIEVSAFSLVSFYLLLLLLLLQL